MPAFWNRVGLAAALAVQFGASATLSFAQHTSPYRCATQPCATQPCAPGRAHVSPTSPCPQPPPWAESPHVMPPPTMETTPAPPVTDAPPMTDTSPMPPMTDTPPAPSVTDMAPAAETPFQPDSALAFSTAQTGIGSPDQAFAPNMMGDLLRAYRGVTFSYLQAGDFAVTNTSGAITFRNSKVAENNSPVPRDRVSFRYNYFKNSIPVRGLASSPALGQPFTVAGVPFQFNQVQPASRDYDVHLYTLGLEKTFFDEMASVEVRVPFARTLDSDLDLVSGVPVSVAPGIVPAVQPTPGQTLGGSDTELQDMNVILKAIIAQDPSRRWIVSSGLGVTIPTGEDLNVTVVDYSNDIAGDPGDAFLPRGINAFAFDQRTREFEIENETWGLAPFLAAAMRPTDRTFVNAFFQIDVPLNSSDWRFRERDIDLEIQAFVDAFGLQGQNFEEQFRNSASGEIDDQTLMHIDVGGGYWLYQNLNAPTVRGIAALLELHYTTTLEDADIAIVPEVPIRTQDGSGGLIGPLDPPRLGNIANRVDYLNLTMGSHVLLGQNALISTAYVVPLRDDYDRTFDGELNVQFNLYR